MSSIYKPENITGYISINYSPVNYNFYKFGNEWKQIINKLKDINYRNTNRTDYLKIVKEMT